MSVRIAIVNSSSFGRIFPEHIEGLKVLGEVERFEFPLNMRGKELAEESMAYFVIIASVTPFYEKEFFKYRDNTLLITRHGIGYSSIDVEATTEKGVIVTKVPGLVEREAIAENAVALLMDIIRKVRLASLKAKEGKWEERAKFIGHEVKDKTTGVIGFGNIGSSMGEILKMDLMQSL